MHEMTNLNMKEDVQREPYRMGLDPKALSISSTLHQMITLALAGITKDQSIPISC